MSAFIIQGRSPEQPHCCTCPSVICHAFWRRMDVHFTDSTCTCHELFNPLDFDSNKYNVILIVNSKHSNHLFPMLQKEIYEHNIKVILIAKTENEIKKRSGFSDVILENDFPTLVTLLKSYGCRKQNLEESMLRSYTYICENIASFHYPNEVISRLCLNPRRFRDDFKYITNFTMRQVFTKEKFRFVLKALRKRKETGNYYALAKECGFESDATLENFMHRYSRKTLSRIESEIKNLQTDEFENYSRLMMSELLQKICKN